MRALRVRLVMSALVATASIVLFACSPSESEATGTNESELSECAEGIKDSASSGTPDTYSFKVTPGDPFSADISGTSQNGGGTWGLVVSDGTSSGVYCDKTPTCSFTVPSGVRRIYVTATTTDIGNYTLSVHCQQAPTPDPASPTPPNTPWVCPGTTVVVGKEETDIVPLRTGDETFGCFGLDVLVGPNREGDHPIYNDDSVHFQLCSSSPCRPETELGGETLSRTGSWFGINAGYHDQSPRSLVFLTAKSLRKGPVKVCYRNVHACQ